MYNRKTRRCDKVRYRDHREAISALHSIANARTRADLAGVYSRRREIRSYECNRCRGYHLTSERAGLVRSLSRQSYIRQQTPLAAASYTPVGSVAW